jgi:hypothetical protein
MVLERQVVDSVQLFGGHSGVGRIDYHILVAYWLYDSGGVDLVALCLDESEVLGVYAFALEGIFVAVEFYHFFAFTP